MEKALGCLGVVFLVAVVAVAIAFLLGDQRERNDTQFRLLADTVRDRTTPPAGKASGRSATTWTQSSAESSWEVETQEPWPQYTQWAARQLAPEYVERTRSDTQLAFSKHVSGDAYYLEMVKGSDGPPLRVRVTFRASAD